MQHQIVPVHIGFDILGRKLHTELRPTADAGGEKFNNIGVEQQSVAHKGFTCRHAVDPEQPLPDKAGVITEQTLNGKPFGEVVTRQDKLCRFAGGQSPPVILAFYAPKFGQVAPSG